MRVWITLVMGALFLLAGCAVEEEEGDAEFRISTSSLPRGMVGEVYSKTIGTKSGPAGPYSWSVMPTLPAGLTFIPSGVNAQIYGVPESAGSVSLTVEAQAPGGEIVSRSLTLEIDEELRIESVFVPAGTRSRAYQFQFEATGGLAPLQWDVATGSLPPGLALDASGQISGSPSATGSFPFRVRVTDDEGRMRRRAYVVMIASQSSSLQIADKLPRPMVTGRQYASRMNAFGGSGVGYTWFVQSGSLPSGISLTAVGSNEAEISGTPTTTGSYPVTLRVQDSGFNSDTIDLVLEVYPPGTIVAFAGGGFGPTNGIGDGGLANASILDEPRGLDRDAAGNIYIADTSHSRIRRIDVSTGVITTVAGKSTSGFSGDGGLGTQAELWLPHDVAVDRANNILYIADYGNQRVRMLDLSSGLISTVAGGGNMGLNEGGQAVDGQLDSPEGIGLDAFGNIYVALRWNLYGSRVRRIDRTTGLITTVAGTGVEGDSGDYGQATSAQLGQPRDVAVDGAGNVYIADSLNNRVRVVNGSTGVITPFAGTGIQGNTGDGGLASVALLSNVGSLSFDGAGNLFIADTYNNRVRRVDAASLIITTVAGSGSPGATGGGPTGDGGLATLATLDRPSGAAIDSTGNLLVSDTTNDRVRIVNASGVISTFAGGGATLTGPAPPTAAVFAGSQALCEDAAGNTYIADTGGNAIYRVDAYSGYMDVYAGTGTPGSTGDGGPAVSATLDSPTGIDVDRDGNLYIAEGGGHRVRRVDALTGLISTVAGTGVQGYGGDGGPAIAAQIDTPLDIAWHQDRSLLILDRENYRIRRVDLATGLISTIAGTGVRADPVSGSLAINTTLSRVTDVDVASNGDVYVGDNVAKVWVIRFASGLIFDVPGALPLAVTTLGGFAAAGSGELYIADGLGYQVSLLSSAGTLTLVAGTGTAGDSGDGGPAISAELGAAYGVTENHRGDLLVVSGNRIRRVLAP